MSLLTGHLRRYVNLLAADGRNHAGERGGGGGQPPLLLTRCLDTHSGDIVEPLPLLIGCLYRMLVLGKDNLTVHEGRHNAAEGGADNMLDDDNGTVGAESIAAAEPLEESLDELEHDLRRLSAAISVAELEDFGLDKVTDFSPDGERLARDKLASATLLCGTYETLMQGALLLSRRPIATTSLPTQHTKKLPRASDLRSLLTLFDRRQTLLELVRPSLPTAAQQRGNKRSALGGSSSSSSSSSGFGSGGGSGGGGGGGDLESVGYGSVVGGGAGSPGFSVAGCFGLTLYPGGMPCLGIKFVEDMLAVFNSEGDGIEEEDEETEGDTERDMAVVDADSGEPTAEVGAYWR